MRVRLLPILLFIGLLAACQPAAAPTPTVVPLADGVTNWDPPVPMVDYVLTNQEGDPVHLESLKGQPTVFTFGYTHCPDVCPVTLGHMKSIRTLLGETGTTMNFVFISVDGARDTPERLKEYLGYFNAGFVGFTSDEATMTSVIAGYGGRFVIQNAGGLKENYTVDHTAGTYLLDAEGQWRRSYAYNTQPDIIAADIADVLGITLPAA